MWRILILRVKELKMMQLFVIYPVKYAKRDYK